jgi:hypothetical protein
MTCVDKNLSAIEERKSEREQRKEMVKQTNIDYGTR